MVSGDKYSPRTTIRLVRMGELDGGNSKSFMLEMDIAGCVMPCKRDLNLYPGPSKNLSKV